MVANFAATHPVRCRGTKGGSYDCFGQVVIGDHNSGHQATIETAFNDDSHTHTHTHTNSGSGNGNNKNSNKNKHCVIIINKKQRQIITLPIKQNG